VQGTGDRGLVFYIGGRKSAEEKIAKEHGIPFYGIYTGKLRRYFDFKNFTDAFKVPLGFLQALYRLWRLKPDLVFAKGGYVSVPVVLAAHVLRIPIWLHESDVTPSLSAKICGRYAAKIWLSFEESRQFFPNVKNIEVVGNPIRKKITKGSCEHGYKFTSFHGDKPVVMIVGGSSGAESMNKIVYEILHKLLQEVQIIHVTGPHSDLPFHMAAVDKHNYRSYEFLEGELADCYAISDLVVSRAGSGSLFEILACGIPMILIPLPSFASRGDQLENAAIFEKHGLAKVLHQETLKPEKLLKEILGLLHDKHACTDMMKAQSEIKLKDATEKIAREMLTLNGN
jgi:UDP-N-acetylglucosamine--N-acetylmuramyl-(pentapeptide) pyrophosphoryl-undecaprenol N-acetylglucosamine transferase